MTWFHTTPLRNTESIERDGILPSPEGVVHLSEVHELVLVGEFTQHTAQTCDCPTYHLAVYSVDTSDLPLEEGWDPDRPHCAVRGTIPPDRLVRVANPPRCTPEC